MGLERRTKELRDEASKNINQKGEKAPTVRTPNTGTSDVPATEQKAITPKEKEKAK